MTIFISPPFGNYIHLPQTKSIKGSYTLHPRDGLFLQVLKTLRLVHNNGEYSWINKIGLRNPGIREGLKNYNHKTDVISIAILEQEEIGELNKIIPRSTNLEINVSCPNAEKKMINEGIGVFLNEEREWCCVKLSPTVDPNLIDLYYKQGFRQFHCSNTYPTEEGGISGRVLVPYTSGSIKYIRGKYPDAEVVAGGGIYEYSTLEHYKSLGAQHFSISTVFFNPFRTYSLLKKIYAQN